MSVACTQPVVSRMLEQTLLSLAIVSSWKNLNVLKVHVDFTALTALLKH